jgi:hypothetical protein
MKVKEMRLSKDADHFRTCDELKKEGHKIIRVVLQKDQNKVIYQERA